MGILFLITGEGDLVVFGTGEPAWLMNGDLMGILFLITGEDFVDRGEGDLVVFGNGEPARLMNGDWIRIFFLITGEGVEGVEATGEGWTRPRRLGRGAGVGVAGFFVLAFRHADGIIFKGSRGGRARTGRFTSSLDVACFGRSLITIVGLLHMSTSPEVFRMASGGGISSLRLTGSSSSPWGLTGDKRTGG
jgi:hypothetical protein